MQPFNILIGEGAACQLYTVLPEKSCYAIIVDDRIVGAIALDEGRWVEKSLAMVGTKNIPLLSSMVYQADSILPLPVETLGREIELVLAGLPEPDGDGACKPG